MTHSINIGARRIGPDDPPFVIAEIGINHEGEIAKAVRMVDDAHAAGCECVKFQSHVVDDEMIPNDVVPGNASGEHLGHDGEAARSPRRRSGSSRTYVESQRHDLPVHPVLAGGGHALALSMDLAAYKIGSGECNNYPLVKLIAAFGRPVILSTGMNDVPSIAACRARSCGLPACRMHSCTARRCTPLPMRSACGSGPFRELGEAFPDAPPRPQ